MTIALRSGGPLVSFSGLSCFQIIVLLGKLFTLFHPAPACHVRADLLMSAMGPSLGIRRESLVCTEGGGPLWERHTTGRGVLVPTGCDPGQDDGNQAPRRETPAYTVRRLATGVHVPEMAAG